MAIKDLMKLNLDTITKISIAVAITATLTMNFHFQTVNNNTINNYAQEQEMKINKTIDKIDRLGNFTQLSDAQILQIVKQILREVR